MGMIIKTLKKPHVWLSLVAGGNLKLQTHYFIFFQALGKGYYGWNFSEATDEYSITPTSGYQSIKVEYWTDGGDITGMTDNGDGTITITTASAHNRNNGDIIDIRGTTDYDGEYTISNVTSTTFDITATFTSSQTGKWFADRGMEKIGNHEGRLITKWDYYSMIDSSTGEPYKWLNLNDPAYTSEYENASGHLRWGQRFDMWGSETGATERIFTDYASAYQTNYNWLYDNSVYNTYTKSSYFFHPQVSYYEPYKPLPTKYANLKNSLIVYFEPGTYTQDDLVNELEASGYDDYFEVKVKNTNSYGWKGFTDLDVFGRIFGDTSSLLELNFSDLYLDVITGQFFNRYSDYPFNSSNFDFTMNRCVIKNLNYNTANWSSNYGTAIDTTIYAIPASFILDYMTYTRSSVISLGGSVTFYNKVAGGMKLVGGQPQNPNFMQWRYQRQTDGASILSDMYMQYYYLYYVDDGSIPDTTGYINNLEFANSSFNQDFDVLIDYYYIDVSINKTMICTNVTSDRNDGQVSIKVQRVPTDKDINDTWKFYLEIDFTLVDEQGNVIPNAEITVEAGGETNTATTDSNGQATVKFLGYEATYSHTADGNIYVYEFFNVGDWNSVNVKIKKCGYRKYEWQGVLKEPQDWKITLQKTKNLNISNVIQFNEV